MPSVSTGTDSFEETSIAKTATTDSSPYPTHPITLDATKEIFDKELKDVHLIYEYDAKNPETGEPEKWKYEMWFYSSDRIVYAIWGGPMAGRVNFQTAGYQCIRPGELWQVNWLEETGTVCSLVYDIKLQKLSTLIAFSKGHWGEPTKAHGDKRNDDDFRRWHNELAHEGDQWERFLLQEQADILENFTGQGELEDFDKEQDTIIPPKASTLKKSAIAIN